MKKTICILLALMFCVPLFGCEKSNNVSGATEISKIEATQDENSTTKVQDENSTSKAQNGDVDIDLTSMSQTVMYAEMSNMQIDPDSYKGKTVKIKGQYNAYQDDEKTKWYYAVVVQDATACCQQGRVGRIIRNTV